MSFSAPVENREHEARGQRPTCTRNETLFVVRDQCLACAPRLRADGSGNGCLYFKHVQKLPASIGRPACVNESVSLLHSMCVCVCVCVCVCARARARSLSREPAPKVSVVFDLKGAKSLCHAKKGREGPPAEKFFFFQKAGFAHPRTSRLLSTSLLRHPIAPSTWCVRGFHLLQL
jgi:hypothetical protein